MIIVIIVIMYLWQVVTWHRQWHRDISKGVEEQEQLRNRYGEW